MTAKWHSTNDSVQKIHRSDDGIHQHLENDGIKQKRFLNKCHHLLHAVIC
jgi:hypothetical protein